MKLYKLDIDTECRTIWVSQEARNKWEKPIENIKNDVSQLELESVIADQRPCSWQTINRQNLPDFIKKQNESGLIVEPIRWVKSFQGFAHKTIDGDDAAYCVIGKKLDDLNRFRKAHFDGDHVIQGELLGFPKCCSEFFTDIWGKGYFDPIWQIAKNDYETHQKKECLVKEINVEGAHPFSNPVLRYIGLRVGFHIPHSFACQETIKISIDRIKLANKDSASVLLALLSMPMEYSVLHGVAIVKTPIFSIITSSVPSAEKYTVRIAGNFIPKEAKKGLVFPYNFKESK